jgi:rod shape determining protein RodA
MQKIHKKFDWIIFALLITLMVIGVIAIFSASTTKIGNDYQTENFWLKQIIWILVSLTALLITLKIPLPFIDLLITPSYIITLGLLILVLFLPEIKGSHRWIPFGSFSFQPSETAKLMTILFAAKLLAKPHLSDWQILLRALLVTIIPVVLILAEPDLGMAVSLIIGIFTMLLISDLPKFYLLLMISPLFSIIASFSIPVFIIWFLFFIFVMYKAKLSYIIISFAGVINIFVFFITPVIWNNLKGYQQNRILTFIDPLRDPFGAGYQIIQSKIAIGSGGFYGKGFLAGTQKNLNFLPEHHTDFIFSVVGEEFGFFGCAIILLLFFLFLFRIAVNLKKLKRKERRFAAVGILTYISFQIFVNIGMNSGVVPTTGIPLPFISYGGSNLLVNVLAIALILKFLMERSVFE